MSTESYQPAKPQRKARVIEVSDLPLSQLDSYVDTETDVHFERRASRTFLVTDC